MSGGQRKSKSSGVGRACSVEESEDHSEGGRAGGLVFHLSLRSYCKAIKSHCQ